MMDHASDTIWTLDNVLYTYFLLILGFLTSDHDVSFVFIGLTRRSLARDILLPVMSVSGVVSFRLFPTFAEESRAGV